MSGSILGKDQVNKLNAAFPALRAHVRSLLTADHSAFGLMKVHVLTEYLDSDEMYAIFATLTFLSPAEKRALVRAAIFEVLLTSPAELLSDKVVEASAPVKLEVLKDKPGEVALKSFTPGAFKLNVNTAEHVRGKVEDSPPPAPVVTSTHTPIVATMKKEGDAINAKNQAEREAAVAELRKQAEPAPCTTPEQNS